MADRILYNALTAMKAYVNGITGLDEPLGEGIRTLAEGDTLTITDNWGRELEYVANINDIYDDYTASLVLPGLRG